MICGEFNTFKLKSILWFVRTICFARGHEVMVGPEATLVENHLFRAF